MNHTSKAEWRSLMAALNRSLFAGLDNAEASAFQHRSLRRMAEVASARSAYYRQRLAPAMGPSGLRIERWSDIPILAKPELRQNRAQILNTKPVPETGPVRMGWTSGSEGEPLNYGRSDLADQISRRITQRFLRLWKTDGRERFAQIVSTRQEANGTPEPTQRRGWLEGQGSGELHVFPVATDLRRHLAWLYAIRPSYLKSYPEVLAELARQSLRQGRMLPMRLLISGGGVLTDDIRRLCREAFGCAIADFYGAEEVGSIADQCPNCGEYHVCGENVFLEIVAEDGSAAAPGETGRAVVTTLFNDAFPLIRYHIGDHVVAGGSTSCSRPALQTLSQVKGRSSAIFRLKGGRALWPFIPSDEMARLANVQRFQFVQVAGDLVEFRYVPRDGVGGVDEALLRHLVKAFIDPSLEVRSVASARLERDENHKYAIYRSLLTS